MSLLSAVLLAGTHAARPAASASNANYRYFETDTQTEFYSTGSAWVQVAASVSVSSPSIVNLFDSLLTGTAASFDITSISGSYKHLQLILDVTSDQSSAVHGYLRFNNDSGTNYDTENINTFGTSSTVVESLAAAQIDITGGGGNIGGTGILATGSSQFNILIPNYASTTFHKHCRFDGIFVKNETTGNVGTLTGVGNWRNTAAISRITVLPSAGNFAAGSRCTLYGLN